MVKTKTVTVRLTDDERALLVALAEREGRTQGDIIRRALRDAADRATSRQRRQSSVTTAQAVTA